MGYLGTWKVLDAMITEFREKGLIVPPATVVELRSAKTLISLLVADPECTEIKPKIEECLFNVESWVVSKGETIFGRDPIQRWIERLDQASRKIDEQEICSSPINNGFPLGVPRSPNWVRISILSEFHIEEMRNLADVLHLSFTLERDGRLLLYGDNGNVRQFIKNMISTKAHTMLG